MHRVFSNEFQLSFGKKRKIYAYCLCNNCMLCDTLEMFFLDAELFSPFEIQEDAGLPTCSNTETCLE